MFWEAVFLLVVLKIPVVYLCAVVWWAIKAEPETDEPLTPVPVADTPSPAPPWTRRPRPSGPREARARGPHRPAASRRAGARAEVRG